ncbi:hypothetical protein OQA88_9404 [Cercophora sp. LCS_1]
MPIIDGKKVACWPCIRGHRVGTCSHEGERPMVPVKKPGRPLTSCPHLPGSQCHCAGSSRQASDTTTTITDDSNQGDNSEMPPTLLDPLQADPFLATPTVDWDPFAVPQDPSLANFQFLMPPTQGVYDPTLWDPGLYAVSGGGLDMGIGITDNCWLPSSPQEEGTSHGYYQEESVPSQQEIVPGPEDSGGSGRGKKGKKKQGKGKSRTGK